MSKTKQYWPEHLAAIAAEAITTTAYAEREGLSASALYYWRRRLKDEAAKAETQTKRRKRKLVPVQIAESHRPVMACTLTLAPGVRLELAQLPDPQWLISLTAATGAVR